MVVPRHDDLTRWHINVAYECGNYWNQDFRIRGPFGVTSTGDRHDILGPVPKDADYVAQYGAFVGLDLAAKQVFDEEFPGTKRRQTFLLDPYLKVGQRSGGIPGIDTLQPQQPTIDAATRAPHLSLLSCVPAFKHQRGYAGQIGAAPVVRAKRHLPVEPMGATNHTQKQ